MNTARPSPFAPAPVARSIHRSARTAISENVDAATGQRIQVLQTSELVMTWANGFGSELLVKYRASRMAINPDRARAERLARRGLGG